MIVNPVRNGSHCPSTLSAAWATARYHASSVDGATLSPTYAGTTPQWSSDIERTRDGESGGGAKEFGMIPQSQSEPSSTACAHLASTDHHLSSYTLLSAHSVASKVARPLYAAPWCRFAEPSWFPLAAGISPGSLPRRVWCVHTTRYRSRHPGKSSIERWPTRCHTQPISQWIENWDESRRR